MLHGRAGRAAAVAVACLAVCPAAGSNSSASLPPFPRISALCHRADFSSRGHRVRAALCRPASSARLPAVVVLHGCGGFGGVDEVLARDLPSHGVATYYIDYFGLTPESSKRGFCGSPRIESSFETWQRIVVDATNALKRMPGIDPARVGAIGWSLGGGLRSSRASTAPERRRSGTACSTRSLSSRPSTTAARSEHCRRRSCFRAEAETPFPSATRGRSTGRCEPRTSQRCCTSIRTGRTSGRADSGSPANDGRSTYCVVTSSSAWPAVCFRGLPSIVNPCGSRSATGR
jgi:acetyl xylan esterase AXE1